MARRIAEKRAAPVFWTAWVMIAAATALSVVGIGSATHESDAVSVERQAKSAHHAIETSIDELALQQEAVAIWDDAAAHVVPERRDMTWIHDNIGSWLHRLFGHNEVFVLDGFDQPIYAASLGTQVPAQRYNVHGKDLAYLVDSVRGRDGGANGKHDRNPDRPLSADSSVRTTRRTTHDSHLMLVGGRPAVASAMLIQPSTEGYVAPVGKWPVLISVRYLDETFLAELSGRQLLTGARLSNAAQTARGEYAVPLRTEWGERIAFLIWRPELPGSKIASRLIPVSLFALAIVAMLVAFLSRRLRRAIDEAATAAREAEHLASHDPLTGLPNRTVLQERLDQLTSPGRGSRPFALMLLDIDEFKITNDTLGHDAGDALLKAVAKRLKSFARATDVVARLGGDEFGVLLLRTTDHQLERLAQKLLDMLSEPVQHEGKQIDCQASAGASVYTGKEDASEVLKQADLALYASKAAGRGTYRLYEPSMSSKMRVRQKMIGLARAALDGDFVEPFYQPKIDLRTGRVVGFEALLRCCPPGQPIYGPRRISAAFEDRVLAIQLTDRILSRVIADMVRWRAADLQFGHVALNAAAADLSRRDFAEQLVAQVIDADLSPADIQLEITESVLLGRSATHVRRTLEKLHEHGVKVALDDFGTGFASLSHLKEFPVDVIKIDRTFISNLLTDEHDAAIVHALVGLAAALGVEVVAEGVETAAQRDVLAALGCTTAQGHLFGRAAPPWAVADLLNGSASVAA